MFWWMYQLNLVVLSSPQSSRESLLLMGGGNRKPLTKVQVTVLCWWVCFMGSRCQTWCKASLNSMIHFYDVHLMFWDKSVTNGGGIWDGWGSACGACWKNTDILFLDIASAALVDHSSCSQWSSQNVPQPQVPKASVYTIISGSRNPIPQSREMLFHCSTKTNHHMMSALQWDLTWYSGWDDYQSPALHKAYAERVGLAVQP